MSFYDEVYKIVKNIPRGKVATYGQIARLLLNPKASRAVGYALHSNPRPKEIPCHRVVNRYGRLTKQFVFGGEDVQKQWLMEEGVEVDSDYIVDLEKYQWKA